MKDSVITGRAEAPGFIPLLRQLKAILKLKTHHSCAWVYACMFIHGLYFNHTACTNKHVQSVHGLYFNHTACTNKQYVVLYCMSFYNFFFHSVCFLRFTHVDGGNSSSHCNCHIVLHHLNIHQYIEPFSQWTSGMYHLILSQTRWHFHTHLLVQAYKGFSKADSVKLHSATHETNILGYRPCFIKNESRKCVFHI